MKKILFIIPSLTGAGAERIITHLINNINKEKFTIELLLIFDVKHTFLEKITSNIKVYELKKNKSLKFCLFDVMKLVKKIKPNTVFIGSGHLGLLLSPLIVFNKKIKWIVRETNFASLNTTKYLAKVFYKVFYKNYDLIIAQCNDMKTDLINIFNIPPNKIHIINNPIDTEYIDSQLSYDMDKEIELPKNKINIVACGRLTYQKGFDLLLENILKKELNPNKYHLTIIGVGENDKRDISDKLYEIVKKYNLKNLVSFVGFKDNIYNWLEKADIFILSSRFEGFPNILLEAIYCGTPVISNICPGGINEIINDKNGIVFDIEKELVSDKVEQLLNTKFIKKELKESIKSKYGIQEIIYRYEKIL
ncbi:glycosyltransferase [Proteus mirabilis]|uniref:glycosyltransferase n=1 Tax=Proteus mirabilis TaxID=584 RepID=UPI0018C78690|nr:glycosyltransferase [Proteus mirabilis]MBG2713496.1 glycosyltransferase [Proteus mirabilis]HEK0395661.1 glycosyltransferase [Proteus mirabilis]HEK0597856.1 glycosyltransferase [Proteus mirabilis]HEK1931400.1 glycosyltransferase [Proteus mirabilis]HEK2974769.1 glycosyltransferase [Proteus mirabilis]